MFRTLTFAKQKAVSLLLAALLLLVAGGPVVADDGFLVIVNASNPATSVPREELSRIFLKKTAQWPDGSHAQPVDLVESSAARGYFSKAVHGKETAAVKAYWQKQIFSGRGVPPAELGSPAEVIAFVGANRGAVGYVPASTALGGSVKAITLAR